MGGASMTKIEPKRMSKAELEWVAAHSTHGLSRLQSRSLLAHIAYLDTKIDILVKGVPDLAKYNESLREAFFAGFADGTEGFPDAGMNEYAAIADSCYQAWLNADDGDFYSEGNIY